MAQGNKLKSALSRMPREKAGERLSPGVYRGAKGNLVTQGGRQIQRQPQAPQGSMPSSNLLLTNQPSGQTQWPHPQSQVWAGNIPQAGQFGAQFGNMPQGDQVGAQLGNMPQGNSIGAQLGMLQQMPQPSANMGGQYRLSPGVYGNRDQAMQQYNQQAMQLYNQQNQQKLRQQYDQLLQQYNMQQAVPYKQG